ncbi:hypothetical protein A3E96_02645 [Candidatus Uhrbacteria bacterium RIFCSPHIGHO2_12_FULL_46_13]|nr:MAG: hypothetical protein A3D60_03705 [Candidatus Uhrbacteria bacterium RIFCSPHIGHO2_02_FULL_47_29]OGL75806.1 MAG: hypothetical protein A3E96_02645 [Candidatus Uhrbacteria bacterium RIFCSPHIGHO2_12_FULL_46_13]
MTTFLIAPTNEVAAVECGPNDPYGTNCTAANANLKPTTSLTPQQEINKLIATIIKTILGLTGVIFMIMIVAAGDLWMTAGGNEEKITKARTMLFNAAVGILLVFGAYIATEFITTVAIEAIGG